ncbi:hypothetical protein ACWDUN_29005 [Mycobacterium sp. NPDC003323]
MTGFHKGDVVAARRRIEGVDVPIVPAGAVGTVTTTTVFGNPKRVHFAVSDTWGIKRFQVRVRRGEVVAAPDAAAGTDDR